MCLSPLLIQNKNRGRFVSSLQKMHSDTDSQYIYVPCGHCPQCVRLKQMYLTQRIQMQSLTHNIYFVTLTYNNDMLPRFEFNGQFFSYADYSDIQKMFKRVRKKTGIIEKYLVVSEYGGKKHRPHFHLLLFTKKHSDDFETNYLAVLKEQKFLYDLIKLEWRRNVGSTRVPIYKPLFTHKIRGRYTNYDLHFVNPRSTKNQSLDVAFYCTKYVLKFDSYTENLRKFFYAKTKEFESLIPDYNSYQEYKKIWDLFRPRCILSKNMADTPETRHHITRGIKKSLNSEPYIPYFYNPVTGQSFPLSPLFRRRYMDVVDIAQIYYNTSVVNFTTSFVRETDFALLEKNRHQYRSIIDKYENTIKLISNRNSDTYELLL